MVHVYPIADSRKHDLTGTDCECKPRVDYIDEDTELPYPNGPLVVHNCFEKPNDRKFGWRAEEK
jgi:hypothetical protein